MCLFFLMAGTGYNAIHYCCDTCRAAGIVHVEEESCDAIHHHDHHHCCGDCAEHHHHNSCWFRHLQLDDVAVAVAMDAPSPEEHILPHFLMPALCSVLTERMLPTHEQQARPSPDLLCLASPGQTVLHAVCRLNL